MTRLRSGWTAVALICLAVLVLWLPDLNLPLGNSDDGRILGRLGLQARNFWEHGPVDSSFGALVEPFIRAEYDVAPRSQPPLDAVTYAHHPPLVIFMAIGSVGLLGDNLPALRLAAFVMGSATVAFMALLLRVRGNGMGADSGGRGGDGLHRLLLCVRPHRRGLLAAGGIHRGGGLAQGGRQSAPMGAGGHGWADRAHRHAVVDSHRHPGSARPVVVRRNTAADPRLQPRPFSGPLALRAARHRHHGTARRSDPLALRAALAGVAGRWLVARADRGGRRRGPGRGPSPRAGSSTPPTSPSSASGWPSGSAATSTP